MKSTAAIVTFLLMCVACVTAEESTSSTTQGEQTDTCTDQWGNVISCDTGGGGGGGSSPTCTPTTYIECDPTVTGMNLFCVGQCQDPNARCWPNDWPGCTGDQCSHLGICL